MGVKPEDNLVGKTIEKCRILGKLGAGGMGSVYLAEHFGLNRKVAIKILPSDMSRDPEYVARFMREATTAGRLEHPNIVQIFDVGYSDGRHYIIMQFVDGESLSTVVENLGAMDPRDAAKVARGILRGLHHAHQQGVVHRDIKPDNVLLAQGDEPKLLDFGLAIETEASLHITKDGMVVGTPYYLSPEQARGMKATPRSDVYATGITLYYLLTGKRPFTGATALAVLNKHIHEAPVPPAAHNPKVPKPLNDIVLKMLAKKPEERYASAGVAADDLDRFLKGQEVKNLFTWKQRLQALTLRQRLIYGGSAGAAAILLVLGLAFALRAGDDPSQTGPGPAVPVPAAAVENPQLNELFTFVGQHQRDFGAYTDILGRYGAYIDSTPDAKLVGRAQEHRQKYIDSIEKEALSLIAKLPNDADPVKRLAAIDGLPRGLLKLKAGERLLTERALLLPRVNQKYTESRQKLSAALTASDLAAARTLVAEMLVYAEGERRRELESIRDRFPLLEAQLRDPLLQAYAPVRQKFEKLLVERKSLEALQETTGFLRGLDAVNARLAKVEGLNYAPFLSLKGQTSVPDQTLGEMRGELAAGWALWEDTIAFRILSDLQDAVDLLWLVRRAYVGVQMVERGRQELALASLGGAGRIVLGPTGFAFKPASGPEKPIQPERLPPAELAILAGAADEASVEKTFETNASVSRAVGAAYLYSRQPDRWPASMRWTAQALRLKTKGPPNRLAAIRESATQEVREGMIRASKEKFDAARKTLSDLLASWKHDPAVAAEVSRALASALSTEILRLDASLPHRVIELGRELRRNHAGEYDEAGVDRGVARALRSVGDWQYVPTNLAGADWTWDGKPGAPAPATDARDLGFKPSPGGRLQLHPVRLQGSSGLSFSLRIDDKRRPFAAGIEIGRTASDGVVRRLVVQDPGQVALYEATAQGERVVRTAPLDAFRIGQWIDLAIVFDAGDLFCYAGKQPLFSARGSVRTDAAVLFISDTGAHFRQIHVRK